MSLFPAYGADKPNVRDAAVQQQGTEGTANADIADKWQSNRSYELPANAVEPSNDSDAASSSSNNKLKSDSNTDSDSGSDAGSVSSKASRNCSPPTSKSPLASRPLEFDSSVEYYVDKSANKFHQKWDTLPPLSRPKYKIRLRCLRDGKRAPSYQRKDNKKRTRLSKLRLLADAEPKLTETESNQIMQRIRELQIAVVNEPQKLSNWIELHQLLGRNVSKGNRLAVAEQQLHKLEQALEYHPGNDQLMQLYVGTASATYPDSQVATKLEQLLERTPYEYTLWIALIMTTQGTMARCNVPDVLNIYEECMRRMHLGPNERRQHTDELLLKLFHNCVLFLRQSANSGHMFALLKLALELNFPDLNFDCFEACAADEQPLVEYEELVLCSGMPMPEIWTRIERLRQAYNFLPYPQQSRNESTETEASSVLDPQRCIYTDDVCHYIYPLKARENTMQLLLIAVQLTKLPFVRTNCLAERLSARIDQIGESEAIEMLLAGLGDRYSYALPSLCKAGGDYTASVLQLAKEMCVSPTFMPHAIGHELYERCLARLLLQCSAAFTAAQENAKRLVFLLLWFRFERMRLLLLKLTGKLSADYVRAARQRMRQLLGQPDNRDMTCLFTEVAMFEYEAKEVLTKEEEEQQQQQQQPDRCSVIFTRIFDNSTDLEDPQLLQAFVVRAEMLVAQQQRDQALLLLGTSTGCSGLSTSTDALLTHSRQLVETALERAAAAAPAAMPLEDYFMPNRMLLLLRAHCLLLCLHGQSPAALALLQQLLQHPLFALEPQVELERSRCRFRREQLRELQLLVLQLPLQLPGVSRPPVGQQLVHVLEQSLAEFPRNLALLQRWSMLATLPWYKLRARLVHTRAGILSLLHLVIAAHCRFIQHTSWETLGEQQRERERTQERAHLEQLVRNRVLSMFETFLPNNPHRSTEEAEQYEILRRNSLYWRLYLRFLSTERTSFERSKSCLLMALDECPWDKALYMDGVTYVPQEVSNLQDVMTEKQLRIFAMPEELNILREA